MREAERRYVERLCSPHGISVEGVYARPAELFDVEYYDERLDELPGLIWAAQVGSPHPRATYGFVIVLRGPADVDADVLRDLAERVNVTCPQVRYVAYRQRGGRSSPTDRQLVEREAGDKSRTERIKEVCDRLGLRFEIKIGEDDTIVVILRGRPGLARVLEAERELRRIVEDDWLITFEPDE